METKSLSKKERIINTIKSLGKLRPKVNHTSIITTAALALILFIAFAIRLFPMRWEIDPATGKSNLLLSEFDPYFQYRFTEKMVKDGFISWAIENEGKGWIDYQRWYPQGFYVAKSAFPGLPMTAAFLYKIVSMLGVGIDLMSFCALFPAIMGALACLAIYLLGKDMGGRPVGLLAALFLALEPSYIQRTSVGFFDDETVGILAFILFVFLFLRAIEENRQISSTVKYAIASGCVLGYFCASWGAAYYPIGLTVLFTLILLLIKRYTRNLFLAYSLTFGLGLFIAINVPYLSPTYLLTSAILPVAGVFSLLFLAELLKALTRRKWKVIAVVAFISLIIGVFVVLWQTGFMRGIAGKFISVVNPFERTASPLYESVAEHRVSAWGSIYYEFGFMLIFFIIGLFFILGNLSNRNIFLLVFGLTSLYFACSMVRLFVLMAPAFSLLAAVGINGLLKPFMMLLKEPPKISIKKKHGLERVGREFSGIAVFLIFLILMVNLAFPMPRVYTQAYTPTTISGGSLSVAPRYLSTPVEEWINMLKWTRNNLKGSTVVCSWWDYGYWLTVLGNVTTLADNATVNGTQIENIGFIFMSNETQAMKMLERYNAEYILVYVTIYYDSKSGSVGLASVGGDEGKWVWMAAISGKARDRFINNSLISANEMWNENLDYIRQTFGNYTLGYHWYDANKDGSAQNTELINVPKGQSSTIYKLMSYAMERWKQEQAGGSRPMTQLSYFSEAYIAGLDNDGSKYGNVIPLVCLYKIDWEKYYSEQSSG
ncbi:MAG: STT3 domain-containing protein [Candidatus Bathyarchaeia archaeon]